MKKMCSLEHDMNTEIARSLNDMFFQPVFFQQSSHKSNIISYISNRLEYKLLHKNKRSKYVWSLFIIFEIEFMRREEVIFYQRNIWKKRLKPLLTLDATFSKRGKTREEQKEFYRLWIFVSKPNKVMPCVRRKFPNFLFLLTDLNYFFFILSFI